MTDLFAAPDKVERPAGLNCPFCGWHRYPDMSKTVTLPVGFYLHAQAELAEHIDNDHRRQMLDLIEAWQDRG